jgi:hypothetical protein
MVTVSFRIVGLYCYFPLLELEGVDASSKVKDVMNAIKKVHPEFGYESVMMGGKEIVDKMSYTFSPDSVKPFNATMPTDGFRDLENAHGGTSRIWQYYRTVSGTFEGQTDFSEIKLVSLHQPSFADLALNDTTPGFSIIPDNFTVRNYNLTWRLVEIQIAKERQVNFLQAKAAALAAKYK